MTLSSDLLLTPDAPQSTHSLHLNSPRLKNRLSYQNSENNNNNISFSLEERKSLDINSLKNNRIIDKEIIKHQIYLESLENKIQTYNEVLEQSQIDKKEKLQNYTDINQNLTEMCSQFDLSNIDLEISFEKKLVEKTELELEMLMNFKKLNNYIESEQANDKVCKIRDQFINYIENDSVTEIDESNIQEKIDQLSQFISDFYSFFNDDKNIQIDFSSKNSHPISPRRIHKKAKNNKTAAPTKSNQILQSPKQLNQRTPQNPFIMRPNNSKIIYNSSLRDNTKTDYQMLDDQEKTQKNIKFVNKNTKSEHASTPHRDEHRSNLRVRRNSNQLQQQINQLTIKLNTSTLSATDDENNEQYFEENEDHMKMFSNDTSNLISEPTTPTSPKQSPRHYQKRPTGSFINDEDDLLDLNQNQPTNVRKTPNGKAGDNKAGNTSSSSKKPTNNSSAKETTSKMMSNRASGLLNSGGGGSNPEKPSGNLGDNQGTGGHKAESKKKGKKPLSLFDFVNEMGHIIVDNFERAIGKPLTRKGKTKADNLALDNPETFKYSTVKADEIVGLEDSDDSDSDNDSDYTGYDSYGYDDAEDGNAQGKSGHHKDKINREKGSHHHHHKDKSKEINMNGLSKEQEEEILKQIEEGGEIPKGYTVLVDKDGKKMLVQTVYGIEDEDDDELKFYKFALIEQEIETKEIEERELSKAKKEKTNKTHRSPPEFEYEVAEDEDFSPIIRKRLIEYQKVPVERHGYKFTEKQRKPYEAFEYIEVDIDETPDSNKGTKAETKSTSKAQSKTSKDSKTKDKVKKATKEDEEKKPNSNNEFSSAQRTQLVKRFIEFELYDIESEGGTMRKCYVPIPPEIEYEWIQMPDDPTTIGKVPKKWGYRWTYGKKGKLIKVCYDKRSMVEEETRDWKGNPTTIMKKVRIEAIQVECDDGIKRTIRRPIQKIEFELFEEENEDGSFSIVKRPIIFTQLENGNWKRLDSENDFFYEQVECDGKWVLQKRHKEYELVDVECDDGKIRKVKREVQPIEYDEIIDEKTGKKKIVQRQVRYAYVIVEDENGNKVRARREILNEDEEYEYIGTYDSEGNFTLTRQKVRYGYRYDFNGRRIRYRIPDNEIIQDDDGNSQQKEVEYEKVEVELEDGRKVKVLRRKEDYEYVMVTDEKTGETRYEKRKVEYTTTTKVDENGNVITVRSKVTQDFDEVEDGVDENGNVIYKKVAREYETITMKNDKGETITVKRARKYNYETVVDENGVAHQVRKEKIKPKRVRKSVKRLVSFPKPLPRSKSFSFYRKYPKTPIFKGKEGAGIKPSTSISNIQHVMQVIRQNGDLTKIGLRNDRNYGRQLIEIQIRNAATNLTTSRLKSESVQDDIDLVLFEIRCKLPRCKLSKPNQITIKKPPVNGSDLGIQTIVTMDEMNEFHLKVKSGMLANKQRKTFTENVQTLSDYLDKLHRDHKKQLDIVESHKKEGDGYLATIKIYKPTPDAIPMPPETRKRMELQKSFEDLDIKCKKIQADLDAAREKLYILRNKEKDQGCINEMKTGKVDSKKKVPKTTMKDLKELKARVINENKKVMSQLKLAEIEEQSLDKKLSITIPDYSENEINQITEKIQKMKKKITQLKKQFRTKRKITEEQAKHDYILSSKEEMAEFEKRKRSVSNQITNYDKKEQELVDNINGMAKVMQKDNLRIPVDRLVTIYD